MSRLDEPHYGFWQTQIWIRDEEEAEKPEEPDPFDAEDSPLPLRPRKRERWTAHTVEGDGLTLVNLGNRAASFLLEQVGELTCFTNTRKDQLPFIPVTYVLANAETRGERWLTDALGYMANRLTEEKYGWWHTNRLGSFNFLGTLEAAAAHFVRESMYPEKGPQWRDPFEHDAAIPLHLMRTVETVRETKQLNERTSRGWYLLSLEHAGDTTNSGELVHREVHYVIGHLGEHAR